MLGHEAVNYSVRLPLALRDQLEQLARAQDRKPAEVVRRLIRQAAASAGQAEPAEVSNARAN